MPRLNEVKLIGHIGKDPEFKTFENGGRTVSFSVATDNSYRDEQSGELKKQTDWHLIVLRGKNLIDRVEGFHKEGSLKGRQVFIDGKLSTRSWEDKNTGEKRFITEVIVFSGEGFQLLGNRNGASNENAPQPDEPEASAEAPAKAAASGGGDDIPF